MPYSTDDTIVAIATPRGRGGIGVVRLSGPDAVLIARGLSDRVEPIEPRHATVARIVDGRGVPEASAANREPTGRAIDEVVLTWFRGPHSYTGEDVVEISAHGSPVLLEQIVSLAIGRGARLAEPGEFTLRAYLHERLDLIQAEAVGDLIDAVTPLQARAAMDQLEGTLTEAITTIDAALFDLAARLEASLDFPEEGFKFIDRDDVRAVVTTQRDETMTLISRGRAGRLLREGRTVVLAGRPNTGKSSLFNALAGAERAIVTDVPGTTRDLLTERVDIGGVPVTIVDTAGIREAIDAIEVEGVSRATRARAVAQLVLVVLDGSVPLTSDDRQLLADTAQLPRLIVINKSDLPASWRSTLDEMAAQSDAIVAVSARTHEGLERLRGLIAAQDEPRGIARSVAPDLERDAPSISNIRHVALLEDVARALARVLEALGEGATEEMLLVDLSEARRGLEEVRGRRAPDDLLHHIFGKFCIGK